MRFIIESKDDGEKLQSHIETNPYIDSATYIKLFRALKDRLPIEQRDLYYGLNKDPNDFVDTLDGVNNTITKSQQRKLGKQNAKLVAENDFYSVYKIPDYTSSIYYGKGTKWCISSNATNDWGKTYSDYTFYFMIRKHPQNDGGDKIALKVDFDRNGIGFYDSRDQRYIRLPRTLSVELQTLPTFDGININDYVNKAPNHEKLSRYKKLLDKGIITQREYDNMQIALS